MKKLLTVLAVAMATVAFAMPDPVAWFRAANATVDEDGIVTGWTNEGSLGSELDLVPNLETTGVKVMTSAYFGGAPYVKFSGVEYDFLKTAGNTSLGYSTTTLPEGLTTFAVFYSQNTSGNADTIFGLHSENTASLRFCQFVADNAHTLYYRPLFVKAGLSTASDILVGKGDRLISVIGYTDGANRCESGFMNGTLARTCTGFWNENSRVWSNTFHVGDSGCGWSAQVTASIAEIRIYNQPLTAAERFQIECELAATYAIGLDPDGETSASAATLKGMSVDAVAFGSRPNGGKPVAAATSATSGDLTAAFVGTPAADVNSLVYLAHDGAADAASRNWIVFGGAGARALPLTLTFSGSDYVQLAHLSYRATPDDAWTVLAVPTSVNGDQITFTLPANWANGQYGFHKWSVRTPTIWLRADKGVTTDDAGKVRKWENQGTLGSAADVENRLGDNGRIGCVADGIGGKPALTFPYETTAKDGDWLISAETVPHGITVANGITYFVVAEQDTENASSILGLSSDNTGIRFGFQSASSWIPRYWTGHFFSNNSDLSGKFTYDVNQKQLLLGATAYPAADAPASWTTGLGQYGAVLVNGKVAPNLNLGMKLLVGGLLESWGAQFSGKIAEIRLYNTALTAAERFCVSGELAGRYGMPLRPDADTELDGPSMLGFTNDPIALGGQPKDGKPSGAIAFQTSGGLDLAFGTAPTADVNSLVYAAHDGAAGAARTWCIAGADGARALPLVLALDGADPDARFYFRASADGECVRVPAIPAVSGGKTVFTLPAGWSAGFYSLTRTKPEPAVWFRADKGVTATADGTVTKWANQGTLGAALDLAPANDTAPIKAVESEHFAGKPAVRFPGGNWLAAAERSTLGLTAARGSRIYVVYKWTSEDSQYNYPYGMYFAGENYPRFFCDYANNATRFFYYVNDTTTTTENISMKNASLISCGATPAAKGTSTANILLDGVLRGQHGLATVSISEGELRLGHCGLIGGNWDKYCYIGDIVEVRVYDQALTTREQAEVEFELATRWSLPSLGTTGPCDVSAVAAHAADAEILGTEQYRGKDGIVLEDWSDGVLDFSFANLPEAGKTLTYIASDGADAAFVPKTAGSQTFWTGRSWYIATAVPSAGAVLAFAVDTSDAAEWKYRLCCKQNGATAFGRLDVEPTVTDGKVSFALDTMENGTYLLQRRSANLGLIIVVE